MRDKILQTAFDNWTDEELSSMLKDIQEEMQRREAHQKAELIEEFRKAWNALRAHNIHVDYYPDDWDDNYVIISDWEQFDFN